MSELPLQHNRHPTISRSMNTLSVKKHMRRLGVRNYGVYPADRLPSILYPSTAIIANTDPHFKGGEHWVAFYMDHHTGMIEYFDSFGNPPHLPTYQQFLRRNSLHPYIYNKYRLQGYNTSVCGHYCLVYLFCRIRCNMSMNDFIQLFDTTESSTAGNDVLVRTLFEEIFT